MKKKLIIGISIGLSVLVLILFIIFFSFFKPKINLNGNKEMVISVNGKYLEKGAIAKTSTKNVSRDIKIKGKVDTTKPGTYEITYIIKENNMVSRVKRKVKVVDDIKPQITLIGGENINVCPNQEYVELGYTAIDNYDGDITKNVVVTKKDNEIIYEVKDSSNNKIVITRKIEKVDKELPQITLKGYSSVSLVIGNKYYESGYNVSDNCDQDIINKVKITNNVNVNNLGTYNIKYEATDSSGNINSVTRTVTIKNPPAPKNSTIYLTFDDGPSSITPKVLDILKEEEVKATFFVLNRSDSYNYLLNRMVNEGHTIGLHGNTHDYYSAYASVDGYLYDLSMISNKVKNVTGVDTKIMRFIGGSSNMVSRFNPGIMSVLTQEVTNRGYKYYDWNVGSTDTIDISSSQVYYNVTSNLGNKSTYVVLMHDYEGNNKTVNALRDIIRYGKNNGYKFDRITESTPQIKHKINN
jgi:peptidoglycan-N-acetylglucosamine deacetylase